MTCEEEVDNNNEGVYPSGLPSHIPLETTPENYDNTGEIHPSTEEIFAATIDLYSPNKEGMEEMEFEPKPYPE